jgi:hypothetical protein
VEAVVSETVDYARGEIPAQIEEKREIARMLKAGQSATELCSLSCAC